MWTKWLPDAELDPHPSLTWLIECCFDLTILALYHREQMLSPGYRLDPGTLVVSNHQRDSDIPILTTVICQRKGFGIRFPLPFYATREDIFRRGFLRNLLTDAAWPRPIAALLGGIPLRWLFRIVRVLPMRRLREFTFGEALAALCDAGLGTRAPGELLRENTLRRIEARLGHVPATLARLTRAPLGRMRSEFWGLRRLRLAAVRHLETSFRARVTEQLQEFAALLDAGRVVYVAPEGTISATGRMRRIRRGPALIYALARRPPLLRPAGLSYDPLGPGRLRVVVKIGEVLQNLDPEDTRTFNAALREAVLSLCAVTPSHLISRWLVAGPRTFGAEDFSGWIRRAVEALRDTPLTLDPLLSRRAPEALVEARLAWLARHRLIRREGARWRNCWPADARPGWHEAARATRYLDNALEELLSLAPARKQELQP